MSVRTTQGSALLPKHTAFANSNIGYTNIPWVRNPSWLSLPTVGDTDQKFVGLVAVYPESNFLALTAAGAYTVDWGDGVVENIAAGVQANHEYSFTDADLANTNAPVTLTDVGDLITRTAHGYSDGMLVIFYNIVSTTGITTGQYYYVINATANTFQVSATVGGSVVALTTNGTATLLPYKQAIVTVTPQAEQSLTALDLNVKNSTSGLQAYETGWLDMALGSPNFTSTGLSIAGNSATQNVRFRLVEQVVIKNLGNVTDMSYRFNTMTSLRSVPLFNTASVTNMAGMFNECRNLQEIPLFNTASVTDMNTMFSNCISLLTVPLFNTSAVTNMSGMFGVCTKLQSVPLFNTSSVTNMSLMFYFCASLQTVPLYNTALVTDMNNMFSNAYTLEQVPLFNTASVTNMNSMFSSCFNLRNVPLFNTASVTNMTSMFSTCISLQSVPLFNTAAVTLMTSMFNGCSSLDNIPLFNTALVTNMRSTFANCLSLTTVPLLNTAAVTDMQQTFSGSTSLQSIPALVVTAVSSSGFFTSIFSNCFNLARIEAKNFRFTFSVANCKLSSTALNEIYTNLPTVTGQTITVTGNYGVSGDNPAIATAKGWTVTG